MARSVTRSIESPVPDRFGCPAGMIAGSRDGFCCDPLNGPAFSPSSEVPFPPATMAPSDRFSGGGVKVQMTRIAGHIMVLCGMVMGPPVWDQMAGGGLGPRLAFVGVVVCIAAGLILANRRGRPVENARSTIRT
jgi:hypothetical protein